MIRALCWWLFELDAIGRQAWSKEGGIVAAWHARERSRAAMQQVDAIFALEGLYPNEQTVQLDAAILAGHVSTGQAIREMKEYVMQYKTINGFMQSRNW